jgi:hypothetical protein
LSIPGIKPKATINTVIALTYFESRINNDGPSGDLKVAQTISFMVAHGSAIDGDLHDHATDGGNLNDTGYALQRIFEKPTL